MSFLPSVQRAIYALIKATLPFGAGSVILSTSQANRISWREALENAGAQQPKIAPPWAAVQFGAMTPFTTGALDSREFELQLSIFWVMSMRDTVRTTVTTGATSATQALAVATNVFVGQQLYFKNAGVSRQVVSIAGLNVTLDDVVTTITGDQVASDVETDVMARLEPLVAALARGAQEHGAPYRIQEDPSLDCSSDNAPNRAFLEMQAPLHAGQLTVTLIVGESGVA